MQHRSNVPSGSSFFYLIFDFDFRSDYMSLKSQSPNFFHHTLAVLNFQAKPASTHPAHPSGQHQMTRVPAVTLLLCDSNVLRVGSPRFAHHEFALDFEVVHT
ncbi:hypothetical protein K443DRAFT_533607 [Laccaria amethystina LaAM-08-1]|uniref:Uncharacterized protein n=1 Tax=Laccaria amethystina LaAM-08-1 TaxID=1095629 RepID=A0A0C9XUS5_9AGAR|nr:hypothetical protein K443DRAFT_533607 [Laccaria amethystina LaAM-08-1]